MSSQASDASSCGAVRCARFARAILYGLRRRKSTGTARGDMVHIAMQEHLDGKHVTWLEHVTDEQYDGKASG